MYYNLFYLFIYLFSSFNYAQSRERIEFDSRSINGNFNIVSIDSTKNHYLIIAKNETDTPVLILQKKIKKGDLKKQYKKNNIKKIIIGNTYYLHLENYFYKRFLFGTSNDKIIIDKVIIYDKDISPYFVYETEDIQGLFTIDNIRKNH